MAVSKEKKEKILDGLKDKFGKAKSVIFADFRGLSVKDITDLRSELRKEGLEYKVAKRTLIKLAAKDAGYETIDDGSLEGPVGAAFSYEEETAGARILAKMMKEFKTLKMVGGLMEGKVLNQAQVMELSKIPSKEVLIAKMMGSMQAPLSGFVGIGNAITGGFVRVVNAIKEQKEAEAK